jgi:galactokinase/mevalonate kinase-like predicted kinase
LDLGGGWTDTPPYSLEHGGSVINAAVNLNGQPPIQVYARVISEPVIRITSIDSGSRAVFRELEELLQYREATDRFGLAKAALVLSGFSPETARWPQGTTTLEQMLIHFGGGIELTTLAAIPSGSGLGTSSIMGAVLAGVINRVLGVELTEAELFNRVLQLEQELTTGGGWQDQIGGAVSGVKMITTEPGLVPDPWIHFVPADLVDPSVNEHCTLLYYTGIRRLAKNILRRVVGRYLDRDRAMMATLKELRALPPELAGSMARKDIHLFGSLIDSAWQLNKRLDPDSTTEVIESILDRTRQHLLGAKLLGAGGGGFLLMVAKSTRDAESVRDLLSNEPPNQRARFFEYAISQVGLTVTVC